MHSGSAYLIGWAICYTLDSCISNIEQYSTAFKSFMYFLFNYPLSCRVIYLYIPVLHSVYRWYSVLYYCTGTHGQFQHVYFFYCYSTLFIISYYVSPVWAGG